MAPFFLIASFDTDDLEGSHSPISTRFRISSQFLLLVLAGWVNRQQQDVIDYQQEENRVLRAGLRGKFISFFILLLALLEL